MSRPRPAATAGVVEKLEVCTEDRVIEKWREGARYGGGNSAIAMPPCWAKRAIAGRCIVDVSVQEVVQPSSRLETLSGACFFSGLPGGWSRARAWRQVEAARFLESQATQSTKDSSRTLLASEILI
jgi:hypothetical protein